MDIGGFFVVGNGKMAGVDWIWGITNTFKASVARIRQMPAPQPKCYANDRPRSMQRRGSSRLMSLQMHDAAPLMVERCSGTIPETGMNNDTFPARHAWLSAHGRDNYATKIMGEITNRIWPFAQIFPGQFSRRKLIL